MYNKSSISVVLPAVQSDHLDPSPRSNQNVVIAPRDNITRMIEVYNADDPSVAKTKTVSRSNSSMIQVVKPVAEKSELDSQRTGQATIGGHVVG